MYKEGTGVTRNVYGCRFVSSNVPDMVLLSRRKSMTYQALFIYHLFLCLAFTIKGCSKSLIPTLTRLGIFPLKAPFSTSNLSFESANSKSNSFSSVLDNLYMLVCATVLPMHWRPPRPKCIKYLARAAVSGLSHRAGSKTL